MLKINDKNFGSFEDSLYRKTKAIKMFQFRLFLVFNNMQRSDYYLFKCLMIAALVKLKSHLIRFETLDLCCSKKLVQP